MKDLQQLVYVSSAVRPFDAAELSALLRKVRDVNLARGLTGMLLYRDGNFIQALEGPPDAVRQTFARIGKDPRHRGLITIIEQPIAARVFEGWSMGFNNLDRIDLSELPGYFSLFRNDLPDVSVDDIRAEKAKIALHFLHRFAQG